MISAYEHEKSKIAKDELPMNRRKSMNLTINVSPENTLFLIALLLVALYLAVFLQLILHEAGHLIFGLISGYHFTSFRIGNLMWLKKDGHLQLKRLSLAGTGGQCLMSPPELVNGKIPFVLYNLGGPLVNLLLGILSLCLYLLFDLPVWLDNWFLIHTVLGFGFAFINGIPIVPLGNDGSNTLALLKSNGALYSFWIQLRANALLAQGTRLKDMPKEWFALPPKEEMKNSMSAVRAVLACNRLLDMHRFSKSAALMMELLEPSTGEKTTMTDLHRGLLICDLIYCEAINENRLEFFKKWYQWDLQKFMKSMKKFPSVLRTEYVYALFVEKDRKKAEDLQLQFQRCIRSYPYPADIESEQELMEIALQKFNKMQPESDS